MELTVNSNFDLQDQAGVRWDEARESTAENSSQLMPQGCCCR